MKKSLQNKVVVSFIFSLFLLGACSSPSTPSSEPTSLEPTSIAPTSVETTSEEETSEEITSEDTSIHVTGVELQYDLLTLTAGKTGYLKCSVYPDDATNKTIIWNSSDIEVATVDNGLITTLKEGSTLISATSEDGGLFDTCQLTVEEKEPDIDYEPDPSDPTILIITADEADETGLISKTINSSYKQIYVNAPECAVELSLEGATIENSENSPIFVASCDEIDISAKKGTTNIINDTRSIYTAEEEGQGKGAIYVQDGDLDIKGKGTLTVNGGYYNGIHGKDDVKIKNLTLNVNAVNHGVRGNDTVTIETGNVNITCGGDGLHTSNSDISSKGKQRGSVTLMGGNVTINSWGDAIDASYDVVIEESADADLVLDAKTNKYSSYEGEIVPVSETSLYLLMNSSAYGTGKYVYAAYIGEEFYPATYKGTKTIQQGGGGRPGFGPQGGGTSTYYVYEIERPVNATGFKLYRFDEGVTPALTGYNAISDQKAINTNYDSVVISVSSSRISFGSWSNYSSNNNSASISAKGLKAANEVRIVEGDVTIKAYDDGIHANKDGYLENGETPLGNVTISGGEVKISASDDGIHADARLSISGGSLTIEESYEGLEANVIELSGGSAYIKATDDGVNATKGSEAANILVSGGFFVINVPTGGDTDGIDSNGSYTQTGGTMILVGPGSATGQTMGAAALDTDGAVVLNGGTLIVFGGIEKTPTVASTMTKTILSNQRVNAGAYTVSFTTETYSFETLYTANGCVVYSELGLAHLA